MVARKSLMKLLPIRAFQLPESEEKISDLANRLLQRADAVDVLPTPIRNLIEVAKAHKFADLPHPKAKFLSRLRKKSRTLLKTAIQKIRGVADLRERVVYIPANGKAYRVHFAQGHVLGHQVIFWHNVDPAHLGDDESLFENA